MSRAITKEEAREEFLKQVKALVAYWAEIEKETVIEQLDGLAFSILNIFDGSTMIFPTLDIVIRPHEDDKEYCIDVGENYYEDGMAINDDTMLHEEYVYLKYPERKPE